MNSDLAPARPSRRPQPPLDEIQTDLGLASLRSPGHGEQDQLTSPLPSDTTPIFTPSTLVNPMGSIQSHAIGPRPSITQQSYTNPNIHHLSHNGHPSSSTSSGGPSHALDQTTRDTSLDASDALMTPTTLPIITDSTTRNLQRSNNRPNGTTTTLGASAMGTGTGTGTGIGTGGHATDMSADLMTGTGTGTGTLTSAMMMMEPKYRHLPTLWQVLHRKSQPPVCLFNFYLYMRDVEQSAAEVDFWLDVTAHEALWRLYVRTLKRQEASITGGTGGGEEQERGRSRRKSVSGTLGEKKKGARNDNRNNNANSTRQNSNNNNNNMNNNNHHTNSNNNPRQQLQQLQKEQQRIQSESEGREKEEEGDGTEAMETMSKLSGSDSSFVRANQASAHRPTPSTEMFESDLVAARKYLALSKKREAAELRRLQGGMRSSFADPDDLDPEKGFGDQRLAGQERYDDVDDLGISQHPQEESTTAYSATSGASASEGHHHLHHNRLQPEERYRQYQEKSDVDHPRQTTAMSNSSKARTYAATRTDLVRSMESIYYKYLVPQAEKQVRIPGDVRRRIAHFMDQSMFDSNQGIWAAGQKMDCTLTQPNEDDNGTTATSPITPITPMTLGGSSTGVVACPAMMDEDHYQEKQMQQPQQEEQQHPPNPLLYHGHSQQQSQPQHVTLQPDQEFGMIFSEAREIVFDRMETFSYPRFLECRAFGNLAQSSRWVRFIFGLISLFIGFVVALTFIFLNAHPRRVRCWGLIPMAVGVFLLISFAFNLCPILAALKLSEHQLARFGKNKEPYIIMLHRRKAFKVVAVMVLTLACLGMLFGLVPGHRL